MFHLRRPIPPRFPDTRVREISSHEQALERALKLSRSILLREESMTSDAVRVIDNVLKLPKP